MDRSAVTQRVWELAEPLALAGGLELVDVQYRPEGGRIVVRLLLDRPEGGVTLDELTRVSREEIGRASCRERGESWGGAVAVNKESGAWRERGRVSGRAT